MKKQLKLTLLSCLLSIPAITQAGPKDDIYRKDGLILIKMARWTYMKTRLPR